MNPPSESKFSVYRAITERIIEAIKAGAGKYVMPWHCSATTCRPVNASTDACYRGINILALWAAATVRNYPSGYWASFRQWQSLGAQVRRGERGAIIVFYKESPPKECADDDGKPRLFARASVVFNSAQVDGWTPPQPENAPLAARIEMVEAFAAATGADIRYGAEMAQYWILEDIIDMPDRARFRDTPTSSATEAYYATLLHELTHWTGAPHRLDRKFNDRFGEQAYAFEELVAELGAAFLCSSLGVANEPRGDHAAYVAHWLQLLNRDHRAIFLAANHAQKAVEYLAKAAAHHALAESVKLGEP